ncbi:MAG: hypothetical protein KAS02_01710 [Candidatus Pacebacteria bacterium]|nr:hypothetical protein [Candidatus Paceibacterota bacterium]
MRTKVISYRNWLPSAQDWICIMNKVKKGESFYPSIGFRGLSLSNSYGYCSSCKNFCGICPLFLKKEPLSSDVDSEKICICYHLLSGKTHFSLFLSEMRKISPCFEKAKYHCKVILGAILENCPDKDRAIRDGIVFD